jgi:hypothetical protein
MTQTQLPESVPPFPGGICPQGYDYNNQIGSCLLITTPILPFTPTPSLTPTPFPSPFPSPSFDLEDGIGTTGQDEVCDNNIDDDLDGSIDEDCTTVLDEGNDDEDQQTEDDEEDQAQEEEEEDIDGAVEYEGNQDEGEEQFLID